MKATRTFLFLYLFLNLSLLQNSAGASFGQTIPQKPVSTIKTVDSKGAKEVLTQQTKVTLLDVRTPSEYASGHLKNALNLDYNNPDFANRLAKLHKNCPYLIYCAVGGRSSKAAKLMQQMGFKQVINVSEGFTSLKNAGMPVAE